MVGAGAIDTNEYDIIKLDESFSFDDVKALGICTHAGFRIPNQNDIVGVLKMFPNLERVDYNVVDSRVKDKVYWTLKLSDIWESEAVKNNVVSKLFNNISSFMKEPLENRIRVDYGLTECSKDTYLSEIFMHGKIYDNVKTGYGEIFKELKKQSPLIDLNLNEIKVTIEPFGLRETIQKVEGDQHPKISDHVLNQLIYRRKYKDEGLYNSADYIRDELIMSGLEIASEDAGGSQIIIRDNRELNHLKYHILKAAEDAYWDKSCNNLMKFQALMQQHIFERTIENYTKDSGKMIDFSEVNIIRSDEKLSHADYNHVLEDHNNQQVVYLPVLQGAGNGDVKKHKEYILDKYIRAHEESGGEYDIPRIIITPKNFRSIFSM